MRLFLAPMEGVVDHHVRDLLTAIGGIDVCVTEFVRITEGQNLPERVFKRLCPELDHNSKTNAGTPVRVQLLGGNPESLAINARKVALMGAAAVDLNFGCPAKMVNKNDGGARLLQEPNRVYDIVKAVREAVPEHVPVSAKIRLGFEDRSRYRDNALAVCEAGANELAVHARSKADGYKPPAYWEYLGLIQDAIDIPVIANGEIWSPEDWQRCKAVSGCKDLMIGRGLLARPDLALAIKAYESNTDYPPMPWQEMLAHLYHYYQITTDVYPKKHLGNRIKQWLMYLRLYYPEASSLFEIIKREQQPEGFEATFHQARIATTT